MKTEPVTYDPDADRKIAEMEEHFAEYLKRCRVPKTRPAQWEVGDIAIEYITLRRDDDPMPPCILLMVTRTEGDLVHCESLDQYRPMTIKANQLMGVAEAVDHFERLADEMTVKSYRLGKQKLEALAIPFAPFPEWTRTMGFWEERPEDRPDGWDVLRKFIPLNDKDLATAPRSLE